MTDTSATVLGKVPERWLQIAVWFVWDIRLVESGGYIWSTLLWQTTTHLHRRKPPKKGLCVMLVLALWWPGLRRVPLLHKSDLAYVECHSSINQPSRVLIAGGKYQRHFPPAHIWSLGSDGSFYTKTKQGKCIQIN